MPLKPLEIITAAITTSSVWYYCGSATA